MKYGNLLMMSLALASAAGFAGTGRYTATLAQPLAKHKEVVGDHNVWKCTEATCILTSAPSDVDGVSSCKELRRQVGTLTAYGAEDKQFDAAKLARCNG